MFQLLLRKHGIVPWNHGQCGMPLAQVYSYISVAVKRSALWLTEAEVKKDLHLESVGEMFLQGR